jgi:predicted lipid-binding transport protein (Tim44 family)
VDCADFAAGFGAAGRVAVAVWPVGEVFWVALVAGLIGGLIGGLVAGLVAVGAAPFVTGLVAVV